MEPRFDELKKILIHNLNPGPKKSNQFSMFSMYPPYWNFQGNIQRRNKKGSRWTGKFWKAYALATNNIIEANESTDSKWCGRTQTLWQVS